MWSVVCEHVCTTTATAVWTEEALFCHTHSNYLNGQKNYKFGHLVVLSDSDHITIFNISMFLIRSWTLPKM